MDQTLLEEIKALALPVLAEEDVELVELLLRRERGRRLLRFLVDKPGGITLDECAALNQRISQLLDQQDAIQESYILEVSSPGLDRPMKTTRDFQRNLGKLARIVLHQPLNRQNVWKGKLQGVDDDYVIIQTEEGKSSIPRSNIARANLEVGL